MKLNTSKARTSVGLIFALLVLFLIAFAIDAFFHMRHDLPRPRDPAFQLPSPLELAALPTAARFDFPIGSELGALAYNAQPFTDSRHLGDDLNGIGGENSDMGDPVFAVADGRVIFAAEASPGWGNVIIVLHAYEENGARKYVQSLYAHLQKLLVRPNQNVRRGEQIATIGDANGRYFAHLHLEMREFITPFIGPGYREDTRGWINPSEFIRQHRGAPDDDVGRSEVPQQVNPVQQGGAEN